MMKDMLTTLRFVIGTLVACSVVYPGVLLALGHAVAPEHAEGSLVRHADGTVLGSRLVAQRFERPEYLWSRPSAVDYDASAAGGSNLASSNPALTTRARDDLQELGARPSDSVPGDLVAASGSGLDPHITLDGALYQVARIADARGVRPDRVEALVRHVATSANPWSPALVNVLEANLALDETLGSHEP